MSSDNHNQRDDFQHEIGLNQPKINQYQEHKSFPIKLQSFNGNLQEAINFYVKQVNKLFFANMVLNSQLRTVIDQKKKLADLIATMQSNKNSNQERRKRHRRSAAEIDRNYKCPIQKCGKCYGSEGSLSQHMKLKHPSFNYDEANEGGTHN